MSADLPTPAMSARPKREAAVAAAVKGYGEYIIPDTFRLGDVEGKHSGKTKAAAVRSNNAPPPQKKQKAGTCTTTPHRGKNKAAAVSSKAPGQRKSKGGTKKNAVTATTKKKAKGAGGGEHSEKTKAATVSSGDDIDATAKNGFGVSSKAPRQKKGGGYIDATAKNGFGVRSKAPRHGGYIDATAKNGFGVSSKAPGQKKGGGYIDATAENGFGVSSKAPGQKKGGGYTPGAATVTGEDTNATAKNDMMHNTSSNHTARRRAAACAAEARMKKAVAVTDVMEEESRGQKNQQPVMTGNISSGSRGKAKGGGGKFPGTGVRVGSEMGRASAKIVEEKQDPLEKLMNDVKSGNKGFKNACNETMEAEIQSMIAIKRHSVTQIEKGFTLKELKGGDLVHGGFLLGNSDDHEGVAGNNTPKKIMVTYCDKVERKTIEEVVDLMEKEQLKSYVTQVLQFMPQNYETTLHPIFIANHPDFFGP